MFDSSQVYRCCICLLDFLFYVEVMSRNSFLARNMRTYVEPKQVNIIGWLLLVSVLIYEYIKHCDHKVTKLHMKDFYALL